MLAREWRGVLPASRLCRALRTASLSTALAAASCGIESPLRSVGVAEGCSGWPESGEGVVVTKSGGACEKDTRLLRLPSLALLGRALIEDVLGAEVKAALCCLRVGMSAAAAAASAAPRGFAPVFGTHAKRGVLPASMLHGGCSCGSGVAAGSCASSSVVAHLQGCSGSNHITDVNCSTRAVTSPVKRNAAACSEGWERTGLRDV